MGDEEEREYEEYEQPPEPEPEIKQDALDAYKGEDDGAFTDSPTARETAEHDRYEHGGGLPVDSPSAREAAERHEEGQDIPSEWKKWDSIDGLDGDKWENADSNERLDTVQEYINADCEAHDVPPAEARSGDGDYYNNDPENPVINIDSERLNAEYDKEHDAEVGAAGTINAAHHEVDHYARDYEAWQSGQEKDAYLDPEQREGDSIGSDVDETEHPGESLGDNYYNWPDERQARESEDEMTDYIEHRYGSDVADEHVEKERPGPRDQPPDRISIFNPEDEEEDE